ncbi:kinase-like protein, partial [Aureobasidium melanogenum]
IIHTDLQPSNILKDDQGQSPQEIDDLVRTHSSGPEFEDPNMQFRLNDLGIACFIDQHLTDDIQSEYLRAPEITLEAPWDPSVDIFSLGCLLFQFLTGELPFVGRPGPGVTAEQDRIALLVSTFGPIPNIVLENAARGKEYEQEAINGHGFPVSLETLVGQSFAGDAQGMMPINELDLFCDFLRKMMASDPRERQKAGELSKHPWLSYSPERTVNLSMAETFGSVVSSLADVFRSTAELFARSDVPEFRVLGQKIEETDQSLGILGKLVAETKDISGDDMGLFRMIHQSARTHIVLLETRLERYLIRSSLSIKPVRRRFKGESAKDLYAEALADIEFVNWKVEIFRRILTIAYWDDVELAPAVEHSALDEELTSTQVYQNAMSYERSFAKDKNSSASLETTDEKPLTFRALDSLTVDEAFGLAEVADQDKEPSLNTENYKSTSASFYIGSRMPEEPEIAPHVYLTICMEDDSGTAQELNCLLDTGASVDCISRDCAKRLAPSQTNRIRRTRTPLRLRMANGEYIESRLKFSGVWRILNKDQEYKHEFYLIDGLPTDVALSRWTVFEKNFLIQNPELVSLGLSDAPTGTPGLNILGIAKTSKEQKEQQDASKLKKNLENDDQRVKQRRALLERLHEAERRRRGSSSGQNQGHPSDST